MLKKLVGTTLLAALMVTFSYGQRFAAPVYSWSKKKTAYIYKEDGTEIKCTIKGMKMKKGLIEEIKIVDDNNKKVKIKPEEVSHMYLPPSGMDKVANASGYLSDATDWGNTDLDKDIISRRYVYYEKSKVKIKKKTRTLMLQVLNPTFCEKIRVYHDPLAGETMSLGVGGVDVVGGEAKELFIKKPGEEVAWELKKKAFDEEFKLMFGDCEAIVSKYGENPKWAMLEKIVYQYSKECTE